MMMQNTTATQTPVSPEGEIPTVARQPDGLGKRVGVKAELTVVLPVKPGGAARFRQNAAKIQADAWYYEKLVGTIHDFRITFINDDTQLIGAVTYDGDFKTYIARVFAKAWPWVDEMLMDVVDGYPGGRDPGMADWLAKHIVEAEIWYASNPNLTVMDTTRAQKVTQAFDSLLDSASG